MTQKTDTHTSNNLSTPITPVQDSQDMWLQQNYQTSPNVSKNRANGPDLTSEEGQAQLFIR